MIETLLLFGCLVAAALWILAMTRWRPDLLRRLPAGSIAWYWLRVFGIPETDRNRTILLVAASTVGILMVTVCALLVVAFGEV